MTEIEDEEEKEGEWGSGGRRRRRRREGTECELHSSAGVEWRLESGGTIL